MSLRLRCVLFFLTGAPFFLFAQDTMLALLPVTVRETRFEQTGFSSWTPDTLPVSGARSLADRLGWENPVSLRINAPGTLATISARGVGPARTPVFWNGLNIQSPQNGVIDLSLIPFWPSDRLELRLGGQSAALSSGAMGGSVILEQSAAPTPGWQGQIGVSGGSFGRRQADALLGWGGTRFFTQTRLNWQRAQNDFPFTNTTKIGQPLERQRNNEREKIDVQQHNLLIINEKNFLKSSLWFQRAHREIPPSMTAAVQETWQNDQNLRGVFSWEYAPARRRRWQNRLAFSDETIAFSLNSDIDSSRARTLLFSSDFVQTASNGFHWKTGVQVVRQEASADGYSDPATRFVQHRAAAIGMLEKNREHYRVSAMARQEWVSEAYAPFTWALGAERRLLLPLWLRMHLSRNFSLPTFNDRFWRSWGNPALRPEKGYSAELGAVWTMQQSDFHLKWENNWFNLLLDDMILWQPGADGIFRPGNLRRVWSRGWESAASLQSTFGKWRYSCTVRYQFVQTTNVQVYNNDTQVLRKQLVYSPRHSGSIGLRLQHTRWRWVYWHQWTGSRYVLSDNSRSLGAYHTGNIAIDRQWRIGKTRLYTELQVENCWNRSWQFFEYYPMPGRAFRAGAAFSF